MMKEFLLLIDGLIAGGIIAAAWGLKRNSRSAVAQPLLIMFTAISLEICIAGATLYVPLEWNIPMRVGGRVIELSGVLYFLISLTSDKTRIEKPPDFNHQ